jgi:hypothetical protein
MVQRGILSNDFTSPAPRRNGTRAPKGNGFETSLGGNRSRDLPFSLYAALNPQTGEVMGQTATRPTSQEFVAFLEEVVTSQPIEREGHVILDNFATHKTDLVKGFLQQHPNVPPSPA